MSEKKKFDPLKKIRYKHIVDEQSIIISNKTVSPSDRAGQAETKRMLEQTLDTAPKDSPERSIYEKIWKGVTRG